MNSAAEHDDSRLSLIDYMHYNVGIIIIIIITYMNL